MDKLFQLDGKVAIVTGGNGGLGLGMALGLAGAGAKIVVAARNPDKTAEALSQIEALGVQAKGLSVDVSREASIKAMVEDTVSTFGRVDILVNNAGMSVSRPPHELPAEDWDMVLDVNLRAGFLASREVYPHMKRQGGGKIINNGSMFSIFGSPGISYSASKGGVVQLTKSLAVAWAKDNIQVNAILPGWYMTELTSAISEDRYEQIRQRIPIGRWGESEELQGAAVFLASQASDYVTGAIIPVDGGYSVA
jgi:2-deoxy-D-gluconate 3-dehydrogenase